MYSALCMKETTRGWKKVKDLLNGLATVLHHSSASLIIASFLTGALVPDRYILDPIFLLVIQHWFALLKYLHDTSYVVIETILEVFFQWSVISQMEQLVYRHTWLAYTSACGMMVAHWLYFIAGFIGRFIVHHTDDETNWESGLMLNTIQTRGETCLMAHAVETMRHLVIDGDDQEEVGSHGENNNDDQKAIDDGVTELSAATCSGNKRTAATKGTNMTVQSVFHPPSRGEAADGGYGAFLSFLRS